MEVSAHKMLVIGLWTSIVLFGVRCFISAPDGAYGFFSCASEAVSVALILVGLYENILWRYNPFEKTPCITGTYTATLEYGNNSKAEKKKADVIIKQSLFTVKIRITTNEITSSTITSRLLEENGEYILYYTYITNPKSKFSQDNPIQYGTCRITIDAKKNLQGIYWTSRETKGDISIKRRVK